MSEAQEAIERLDDSLAEDGENVIFRRGNTDVPMRVKCRGLKSGEVGRMGSSGRMLTAKGIASPSDFVAAGLTFPVRVNSDKIVRGGQERVIEWVDHVKYGDDVVRVLFEFIG